MALYYLFIIFNRSLTKKRNRIKDINNLYRILIFIFNIFNSSSAIFIIIIRLVIKF
jgi:hypothetical protein